MRAGRAGAVLLTAATALVALNGGACQPAPPPAVDPGPSYPADLPQRSKPEDPLDLRAYAPVPSGLSVTGLEFVDADQGYAFFQHCQDSSCTAALAVTLDGGNSWLARKLPYSPTQASTMQVGRGNVVMLRATPQGWFISKDSGRTFQQRPLTPLPTETNLADPPYVVRCPSGSSNCSLRAFGTDGKEAATPTPPPFDLVDVKQDGTGRLWALGRDLKNPGQYQLALSTDRGRTWIPAGTARLDVPPEHPPIFAVSPDATGIWLVGSGYGRRRQPDGTWVDVPSMGNSDDVRTAVALDGGVLLVAGTRGAATVTDGKWVPDAPPEVARLRDLGGGTVQGYVRDQPDTVWLCRCADSHHREWVRVSVSAP